MKIITITGNLGSDAVVKTSNGGTEYMTLRIAVNGDTDDNTMWFSVRCFNNFIIKHLSQHLKKGKTVEIVGDYSDRLYLDKNNTYQISREVNAYNISFPNFGRGDSSGERREAGNQQQNEEKENVQPTQPADSGKAPLQKQGKTSQPAPVQTQPDAEFDDELPF